MNGFLQEVLTQGELLRKVAQHYREKGSDEIAAIAGEFEAKKMDRVVLTGMGSSLYAADCIRSYLTGHGIPTLSFSSYELARYQFGQLSDKTLVIAISQSGNSPEVVELVERAKHITTVVGIYNNEDGTLAELADYRLPILAGPERSITSKTYEITMLILNILARKLVGTLDEEFWVQLEQAVLWCESWCAQWQAPSLKMHEFAQGTVLYDLLANDASLATARQLSLACREGLHNCVAVWECADYAHGQYHSAKMGNSYLAQMFFPTLEYGTKEMKMLQFILDHGGKVMLYTHSDIAAQTRLHVVKMPKLVGTLMPLAESLAAETFLGLLFGPDWVKDH